MFFEHFSQIYFMSKYQNKSNGLQVLQSQNFFKRLKHAFLKASNIKYFKTFSPCHEGVSCVAKLSMY